MFCQDSDIIKSVTHDTNMSGDSGLEEPIIFYSSKMTTTKRVLIELKNKNESDVVEIQGVSFQHRWRKGSAMEEQLILILILNK